ncbi:MULTISPECIES: hypothetical protein [unclassified Pseudodesulfovibrio]|uniref:hypothetical protein n=1 Tax=unclassified Pseudodesulfovibrio TaxID=2661612 RepID=UPI000FEBD717|nr:MULTISPECIES: hypothetical protein [unclassified Pseudodesulfovibrio]MCJ2165817.1 hypothetical protein [Pseudodesulfovibrio sp. S3-i]RWU02753.1 hypothetical protein DWB63_14535 [Pseudodesulfovibrio sp. S3]
MSYLNEFKAAAGRTKKMDLGEFSVNETPFPIDQTILNTVEEAGHIPFAERAGKALSVNFGMFHMLTRKFHIPGAILTMGNVAVNGEMRMQATPNHFKKMVQNESGEEDMGLYHLWTTLPGGVILDHVLPSALHLAGIVEVNEAVPSERYIFGQADGLPHGITYHPMVVGLEFFIASGTIDREAMEYLMGEKFPKQYG